MRCFEKGECIREGTYKNGKLTGLARNVYADLVIIGMYKDDTMCAQIHFDSNYNITFIYDCKNRLTEFAANSKMCMLNAHPGVIGSCHK